MTTYALVENGEVTRIGSIPVNFNNIGGFDKIKDDAVYKSYGFLPYTYSVPEYDQWTQRLGGYVYDIGEDSVHGSHEIIDLDPADIAEQQASATASLKYLFHSILYDTDWIYCGDSGLSESQLEAYTNLRASILSLREELQHIETQHLYECSATLGAGSEDFKSRTDDFTENMTAIVDCLTDLSLMIEGMRL